MRPFLFRPKVRVSMPQNLPVYTYGCVSWTVSTFHQPAKGVLQCLQLKFSWRNWDWLPASPCSKTKSSLQFPFGEICWQHYGQDFSAAHWCTSSSCTHWDFKEKPINFTFLLNCYTQVTLWLNVTFCWGWISNDFSLVVLPTRSVISFHLWCMLGISVWIWMKSNSFSVHWGPNSI
jgi:hypothetical protein